MTKTVKNMIFGSMAASALVLVAAVADIATGYPFGGQSLVMDILFIVAAGVVLYLAYESYKELS